MEVKSRLYKDTLYINLIGELDEHTAEHTRVSLDRLLTSRHLSQVVIDLAQLGFMDSTGIGILIGRYKKMKEKGVPIFICNPSSQAERIFKMTGLYSIMPKIS